MIAGFEADGELKQVKQALLKRKFTTCAFRLRRRAVEVELQSGVRCGEKAGLADASQPPVSGWLTYQQAGTAPGRSLGKGKGASVYSERLTALFRSRAHAGNLEDATCFSEAGTPGRGPYMRLWLRVEAGVVTCARYKTFGCPAAIACGEALCELVEGELLAPWAALSGEELATRITTQVGGVPENKAHCPQLAAEALVAIIRAD